MNTFMKTEDDVDKIRELREEISRLKEQIRALQLSDEKREKAEELLTESEERFRATFEQAAVGIAHIAPDGRFLRINSKFRNIVGYTHEELLRLNFQTITYPDDLKTDLGYFNSLMAGTIPTYSIEKRYIRKDRSVVWVNLTVALVTDGDGQPRYLISVIEDITERKQAEEAIRESREMLRLVMDNIPQRIFWKDLRSNYLGCNANFAQAAGVGRPENIAGKTDFDLAWTRTEAESYRRDDREVMDNDLPKYHIIEPQLQADGRRSWLDTNKVPLHDAEGNVIGILGTYEDITERLKLEERLRLTQFSVDHFTDSSIWLSPQGEILYVNDAACRSLGYTSDELLAMHIWDVDPDYTRENYSRIWDELKRRGSLMLESKYVTRGGRQFPVEVSANYITFQGREYLISFDRDITERKLAEKQLEEAKSQAELYVDLMSHDIGNMDQAMLGYLEMAIDTLRPEGAEKELLTQPLAIIENSTRLINNVRKLRQLQASQIPVKKIDLGKLLSEVAADFSRVPGRDVRIDYSPVSGCIVEANDLLKDLFSNLIDNAIRHSSGSLHINIELRKVAWGSRDGYQIAVEDNGPGISDQLKEKLLSVARGGVGKAERRGIGLLLVKALLEKFHGTMRIEDRVPGDYRKGSRVVVLLPAAQ
jgi:PAS domain S-box-containing protein